MSEEETKNLAVGGTFEKRLFSELAVHGELLKGLALRMSAFEDRLTSLEDRFDARFAQIDERLTSLEVRVTSLETKVTSLEEKVDARLRETRPIWEAVQASVLLLDKKFDLMVKDLYDLRGNFGMHESWLRELDRRVNP